MDCAQRLSASENPKTINTVADTVSGKRYVVLWYCYLHCHHLIEGSIGRWYVSTCNYGLGTSCWTNIRIALPESIHTDAID